MPNNPNSITGKLFPTNRRLIVNEFCRKNLPIKLNGKVLVVGAGFNPYSRYMSGASSVLVTDIKDEYDYIDQVADVLSLPFDDLSFDSVVAVEVLEHISDPNLAASEIYRVLVDEGKAFLSVPFLFRVHGDPSDYHRFTKQGLLNLFAKFSYVAIYEMGNRLGVISDIISTTHPALAVLVRPFNHLLSLLMLNQVASKDCPSGYWIEVIK